MPVFTIETTYRLPVCRHQTYEAATTEEACRLAVDDDDWSDEKRDYESAGEPYVTGIWSGENAAYSGAAQPIPSHYVETPSALDEFRGCDLVCFCAPRPCHGDLLLRLANATRDERIAWWRVKVAA
jgi:Domain of unknown function (DUF4326)